MRGLIPLALCLFGAVTATTVERRQDSGDDNSDAQDYSDNDYDKHDDHDDKGDWDDHDHKGHWKPKTKDPHFFQVKVDDKCSWDDYNPYGPPKLLARSPEAEAEAQQQQGQNSQYYYCPLRNYALRLEKGIAIVTPYNKWWDAPLPTFFVDDDTQLYTVSKEPLQLYIDGVTGALKYSKRGWLPPNSISTGFFHTGTNPLGRLHESPSLLSWPTTPGLAWSGEWWLCKLGYTGQWQVFANNQNFDSQGLYVDSYECSSELLAAVNANPWKKKGGKHWDDHDKDYDNDWKKKQ